MQYVRSDVQSSRLPQFDLANPGFQLIWMKIFLPHTSKFICTLYCSPNSPNHEILLGHLFKRIDTITLQSPHSEITVLGDLTVYNTNWLTHSLHITSPAGRDAEAFAIVNDLSQLISELIRIPDHPGNKAYTLDLILASNPDIYFNPLLILLLVTLTTALSRYSITLSPTRIDLPLLKKFSTIAKLTWTLFKTILMLIPGILACLMILPLLPPSSLMQFNLVWIFLFQPPINLAKSHLQSGSLHNVQKLSNINNTALNNGGYTKLHIQELYVYRLITYAPKPCQIPFCQMHQK